MGDAAATTWVYRYMRYSTLLAFGMLIVPIVRSDAQSGWISADLGLGSIRASTPYASSIAVIGHVGIAVRRTEGFLVEFEGHAFGTFLPGDAYSRSKRPLPNTLGLSVGVVRDVGRSDRLALNAGVGFYRVAHRGEAAGGDGFGVHAGGTVVLMRRGSTDITLGLRAMLLPDIAGSRIRLVPLSAGIRVH
jgi:hypothetical protein